MTDTTTGTPTGTRWPLARPYRLSLDSYARITGVHPELVRRLVALGLLDLTRDAEGNLWFDPSQVRAMADIQRLHLRLNLTYSSLGLVMDLLNRISDLERSQRRSTPREGSSMDLNRLTQKSQEALHDAQTKALRFGHQEVDGEHLLLAVLEQSEGLVPPLLARAGADVDRLREDLEAELEKRPRVVGSRGGGREGLRHAAFQRVAGPRLEADAKSGLKDETSPSSTSCWR